MFVVGYSMRDLARKKLPSKDTIAGMVGLQSRPNVRPSKVFSETYDHILSDYYKPVPREKLRYAGMAGVMAALGDPHTVYMEPKLAQDFKMETSATFAGVGARLAPDTLGARVAVVFDGGPADKAGLKAGDLIVAVNGKAVGGWDVNDIVDQVRGKEGTFVNLKIMRGNPSTELDVRIQRARIVVPTVNSKVLEGTTIGYMDIASFSEPTPTQFLNAITKMEEQKITGLVIDLRGNPGGLLESAVYMLANFVESKVVVKMKLREDEQVARTPAGRKRSFNYPIVVLVNEESASAAEIMAGVMQDYKVATIVGEHTYGKASVQTVFPLQDGASAKITIAKYFLPSGRDISRKVDADGTYESGGLKVDVEVPLVETPAPIIGDPKADSQLKRAIEVLETKSNQSARLLPSLSTVTRIQSSAQAVTYEV